MDYIKERKNNILKYSGKEIFEIKPVIVGGDPNDLNNKTLLNREDHINAVSYWNNKIREHKNT